MATSDLRKRSLSDDEEGDNEIQNILDGAAKGNSKRRRMAQDEGDHDDASVEEKKEDNHVPFVSLGPRARINAPGKQAEAGIIHRVYVENFMCHRKLTINLCRNVNFIHGQNGSGKSAILAAIQICLGAGARRTHRARNLKELVRKESAASSDGAKVQVTLLNRGEDAYKHDIYGDFITIERSISVGSGFSGYKLLDHTGKERSRNKKELDAMLDQLNIQVENPVAVLDQEEAKKFLMGKAEDKYALFTKATELERLDRSYAAVQDNVNELSETQARIIVQIKPASDNVKKLRMEWEQFQQLEKLEDEVSTIRVEYAWSVYRQCADKAQEEEVVRFSDVRMNLNGFV